MNRYNLDKQLKKLNTNPTAIPAGVRTRLDETYASLPEVAVERPQATSFSRIRKITATVAAASVLGVAIFASGFVSPVMADSIKKIPLFGSLFSSIESDIGLRTAGDLGLTSAGNSSIAYEDITLDVTETVFDGTRAAFLVNITAPNLKEGQYDNGKEVVQLSQAIDNITLHINGRGQDDPGSKLSGGLFYSAVGEAHPNMLLFEQVFDTGGSTASASMPDSFQAEVSVSLQGIDHEFKLEVPFHKTSHNIINIQPNVAQTMDDITVSISDISMTPLTTRLSTAITLGNKAELTEKEQKELRHISVAVFDDQGRQLPALNGEGVYEGNTLIFDRRYASTPGQTKFLVLKPFKVKDDFAESISEGQYIKELEMKVDLPVSE